MEDSLGILVPDKISHRIFSQNKKYVLKKAFKKLGEAKALADKLRADGWRVIISPCVGNRYAVYVRSKRIGEP